ncbi:MAG: DNA/RNA endonuclease G [Nitrospirales bacterium]|nr:DNA/RNA endonuclease G [Nitrospirales bacterium]
MIEIPSLRPESRYGIPTSDLLLFNRQYIVGYSYLFRQPRWAMQIIGESTIPMEDEFDRLDNFREDFRIPEKFRSTLNDYKGSGFDRGHLINSADRKGSKIINSETFLLSNMSPQKPGFNHVIWLKLEKAVRVLAESGKFAEVYTICGPLFAIGRKIKMIGDNRVVVPDAFFKSVLAEKAKAQSTNQLAMWSFVIPNAKTKKPLKNFLVPTVEVERRAGLQLWDRLRGEKSDALKTKKGGCGR